LFLAFAEGDQVTSLQVHVAQAQLHQLGNPEPSCVQGFQHCTVAQPARRGLVGSGQKALDLVEGKEDGQLAPEARQIDFFGGIAFADALGAQELEELAQGYQRARLRPHRQLLCCERGHVVEHVDGPNVTHPVLASADQEPGELGQVVPVGCDRGDRQLALDPQMVEELLNREVDAEAHGWIVGRLHGARKFLPTHCDEDGRGAAFVAGPGRANLGAMKTRIGGRDLSYAMVGEGRAVILVHAFPLDGRMWQDTAKGLSPKCRVIAPDLRGFGESALGDGKHSIADMADDLAALMDNLGIAKATVGGLSMGGYVSLAFAARHRDRLEGLILADTRAAADSDAVRAGRADALALVEKQGVEAFVERQLAALLSPSASEVVRHRVRALGRQGAEGVCAGIRALRDRPDRFAELSSITCPTLVIVGTEDKISPLTEMAEMAHAIAGSRLTEIGGAGHLSNLEKPSEFEKAGLKSSGSYLWAVLNTVGQLAVPT